MHRATLENFRICCREPIGVAVQWTRGIVHKFIGRMCYLWQMKRKFCIALAFYIPIFPSIWWVYIPFFALQLIIAQSCFSKAIFTADATANQKHRKDYAGGEVEGGYYLKNCGFFNDFTQVDTQFTREITKKQPEIDLKELESKFQN